MRPTDIINKTNRSYTEMMYDLVRDEPVFDLEFPTHRISERIVSTSGILIPRRGGYINSLQHKLVSIVDEVEGFWKDKRETYVDAVQKLSCCKLHAVNPQSHLLLFFDTLVVSHGLPFVANANNRFGGTVENGQYFGGIVKLLRDFIPYLNLLRTAYDRKRSTKAIF